MSYPAWIEKRGAQGVRKTDQVMKEKEVMSLRDVPTNVDPGKSIQRGVKVDCDHTLPVNDRSLAYIAE